MKRVTATILLLAMAGCGGGGESGGNSGPGSVVGPPSTPTPPPNLALSYTPAAAATATAGVRLPIGKCVNLGNHLEAPNEGDWGRAIADDDLEIIKAAGFDSVRIPVRWSGHALLSTPYTVDPAFMSRVKHVVALAEAQGLGVILNMHHYEELFQSPAAHADRFAEIWRQIAAEFSTAGNKVWFELINEPNGNLNDSNLLDVLNPALANVRISNPTRPVIIGGQNWSGVPSLATLQMPNDPYLVPTFHTYDPFNFTHQGATWVVPTPPLGRTFGSAQDVAELNANLQAVQNYIQATGRVPFVGEYGANDHPQIPLSERVKYYEVLSSAYASIGVQSCAWGYTNTFRLRNESAWLPGMLSAIKTTTNL